MSYIKMRYKKTHFDQLKDKWVERHKGVQKNLWQRHKDSLAWVSDKTKHLAVGSLGTLMLATIPAAISTTPPVPSANAKPPEEIDKRAFLIADLSYELPKYVEPLTPVQEDVVAQTLSRHFGIKVAAELGGIRLNRSYGYIGKEQHLARYPGDTIFSHFDSNEDARKFATEGMAPGLGAYGYFAKSYPMSEVEKLREKYYIAVQTFLAPGYNENPKKYNDFFRFRKMLVVNAQNGKAIVAVIGDAGPADWTGKHLGASPEVMDYLERFDGSQKGPVLYFFVDDPFNEVPLGPIEIQPK